MLIDYFVPFSVETLILFVCFCSDMGKRKRGGERSSHKGDKLNQWREEDMAAAIQGFRFLFSLYFYLSVCKFKTL